MIAIFSAWNYLLLLVLYIAPSIMFIKNGNTGALVFVGSAVAFISIYLTRLGANNSAIGWLTAGPALMNLLFALPIGQWIAGKRLASLVFWASLGQRSLYLLLAPMPLLLPPAVQIPAILLFFWMYPRVDLGDGDTPARLRVVPGPEDPH